MVIIQQRIQQEGPHISKNLSTNRFVRIAFTQGSKQNPKGTHLPNGMICWICQLIPYTNPVPPLYKKRVNPLKMGIPEKKKLCCYSAQIILRHHLKALFFYWTCWSFTLKFNKLELSHHSLKLIVTTIIENRRKRYKSQGKEEDKDVLPRSGSIFHARRKRLFPRSGFLFFFSQSSFICFMIN